LSGPLRRAHSCQRRRKAYATTKTLVSSRTWNSKYRGFFVHHHADRWRTYGLRTVCVATLSPRGKREKHRPHQARRGAGLQLLDRACRIDVLRAHDAALPDERALPDPVGGRDGGEPLLRALVPGVHLVPEGEGGRGGAQELLVVAVHGARRVAEHAVDAQALLAVQLQFLGGLAVLPALDRL